MQGKSALGWWALGMATLLTGAMVQAAGNIDPTSHFVWSENAGWVNFAPEHGGGVTVSSTHLSGYAWAENIGWIKLGVTGGGPYANTGAANWGVNVDESAKLSGFAWSENAGWINFHPEHSQVTIKMTTGQFEGYAWGENIGWIKFSGTAQNASEYGVRTTASLARGTVISIK